MLLSPANVHAALGHDVALKSEQARATHVLLSVANVHKSLGHVMLLCCAHVILGSRGEHTTALPLLLVANIHGALGHSATLYPEHRSRGTQELLLVEYTHLSLGHVLLLLNDAQLS